MGWVEIEDKRADLGVLEAERPELVLIPQQVLFKHSRKRGRVPNHNDSALRSIANVRKIGVNACVHVGQGLALPTVMCRAGVGIVTGFHEGEVDMGKFGLKLTQRPAIVTRIAPEALTQWLERHKWHAPLQPEAQRGRLQRASEWRNKHDVKVERA